MKVDPLNLILGNNKNNKSCFYFISGNEITLMEKIKDILIKNIIDLGSYSLEKIKNVSFKKEDVGLFKKNKLFLMNDIVGLSEDFVESVKDGKDKYIVIIENSPKSKSLKNILSKRSDSLVIDCYELTKESKGRVIKKYLNDFNISFSEQLYWTMVDKLDNRFLLLEGQLIKLQQLNKKNINPDFLDGIITNNSHGIEKIL